MTSHDVVQTIRKISGQKRVGHAGTLDPMACGVLPICLGKSTRAIEYMDRNHKRYKCSMQFGMATDTQDIWGNLLKRDEEFKLINFKEDDIKKAFLHQKGDIMQIPPKYSAVKIGGKRLYEYARSGPFNNHIIIIKMKPDEIRSLTKNSHKRRNKRADLFVSGMTYKIFTKDGIAELVEMKMANGKLLDENKYYRVGINDYLASAYTYEHKKAPQITDKTSEETLVEYIRNKKQITPQYPRTEVVEK